MIFFEKKEATDLITSIVANKVGIRAFDESVVGCCLYAYYDDGYNIDIITFKDDVLYSNVKTFVVDDIKFTEYIVNSSNICKNNDLLSGMILYDPKSHLGSIKESILSRRKVIKASNELVFDDVFISTLQKKLKEVGTERNLSEDIVNLKKFLLLSDSYTALLSNNISLKNLVNSLNYTFFESIEDNRYALAYAAYKFDNALSNNNVIRQCQEKMLVKS